jgi:hypothetical protein
MKMMTAVKMMTAMMVLAKMTQMMTSLKRRREVIRKVEPQELLAHLDNKNASNSDH